MIENSYQKLLFSNTNISEAFKIRNHTKIHSIPGCSYNFNYKQNRTSTKAFKKFAKTSNNIPLAQNRTDTERIKSKGNTRLISIPSQKSSKLSNEDNNKIGLETAQKLYESEIDQNYESNNDDELFLMIPTQNFNTDANSNNTVISKNSKNIKNKKLNDLIEKRARKRKNKKRWKRKKIAKNQSSSSEYVPEIGIYEYSSEDEYSEIYSVYSYTDLESDDSDLTLILSTSDYDSSSSESFKKKKLKKLIPKRKKRTKQKCQAAKWQSNDTENISEFSYSENSSDNYIAIRKKPVPLIHETQYTSDDSDIVVRKKRVTRIRYTLDTQDCRLKDTELSELQVRNEMSNKNLNIENKSFNFNDNKTLLDSLEESMIMYSSADEKDNENIITETSSTRNKESHQQEILKSKQGCNSLKNILVNKNEKNNSRQSKFSSDSDLDDLVRLLKEDCDRMIAQSDTETSDYNSTETEPIYDAQEQQSSQGCESDVYDDAYCNAATQKIGAHACFLTENEITPSTDKNIRRRVKTESPQAVEPKRPKHLKRRVRKKKSVLNKVHTNTIKRYFK